MIYETIKIPKVLKIKLWFKQMDPCVSQKIICILFWNIKVNLQNWNFSGYASFSIQDPAIDLLLPFENKLVICVIIITYFKVNYLYWLQWAN